MQAWPERPTTHIVHSVTEIEQRLGEIQHAEPLMSDYVLTSTSEMLYLDNPLTISTPAWEVFPTTTLFFGVQSQPQQRLKLVCRKARTALIIRYNTPIITHTVEYTASCTSRWGTKWCYLL
jgi:hypothetical protein